MKACPLFALLLVAVPACSLLLDRRADQCASDGDCTRFSGTRCDMSSRLCIVIGDEDAGQPPMRNDAAAYADARDAPAEVPSDAAADPCVGPGGCYQCPPTSDLQFANGCTNAACRPFDNRTRLKNRPADGGLSPLPEREAGQP
jgi:hypothetical protein